MKENYFNIVVKKILKSKSKIIDTEFIKSAVKTILDENFNENKAYKIIYALKNKGYILSLKKDLYFIKGSENIEIDQIIQNYYWQILQKQVKLYLGNDWYIGGIKALELNNINYDIPDDIDIINSYKQSKEVVLTGKNVLFKKYTIKDVDIFKKLKKQTKKIKIGPNSFQIANLELSILETLYSPDSLTGGYGQELIKKVLRKQGKYLNLENISYILGLGKHHTSLSRLYKISKGIDNSLSEKFLPIIKKYSFMIDV